MNNRQDRTPQFYDAHTRRSSPLHHLGRPAAGASATPRPQLHRQKSAGWVSMALAAAILYGIARIGSLQTPQQPLPAAGAITIDAPFAPSFTVPGDTPLRLQAERYYDAADHGRAAAIYLHCAQQGDAECQRSIAYFYSNGLAVPQDDTAAFHWLEMAARQGNAVAQDDLGVMYGDGRGVKQDWVQSFLWISRAAAQGLPQARKDLQYALQHMTTQERIRAMRLWQEEENAHEAGHSLR